MDWKTFTRLSCLRARISGGRGGGVCVGRRSESRQGEQRKPLQDDALRALRARARARARARRLRARARARARARVVRCGPMSDKTLDLWDIDGTLVTTAGAGRRAIDRAFLELHGWKDATASLRMDGRTDPWIVEETFRVH